MKKKLLQNAIKSQWFDKFRVAINIRRNNVEEHRKSLKTPNCKHNDQTQSQFADQLNVP